MVEQKIKEILGYELPPFVKPLGNYVPSLISGNLLYTSGQVPLKEGKLLAAGHCGKELTKEQGKDCALQCAINALASVKFTLNDLNKIHRVVRASVFVNSASGFTDQPFVANGVSDFLVQIFGENGKHTRLAIGVAELPINSPCEVDIIFELKP